MTQAHRRHRRGGDAAARTSCGGFTLIELVTVIVILGIISVFIATRGPSLNSDLAARQSELRAQLRYLQLTAMKNGVATYLGLKCDGTNYWAFSGTTPAAVATYLSLPGETAKTISLSGKGMTGVTAFTISFDKYGIPYTGDTQIKLAASTNISITAGGGTGSLTVTPETGFVP